MTAIRPAVFIGSSKEGHEIARAVRKQLRDDAEVTVWDEGVFGLGEGSLESLVGAVKRFDFAILVLSPDDMTTSRRRRVQSPRDNVLFELGLFMGRLGRYRTYIVFDSDQPIKIPSDLAGVTQATYHGNRSDRNLEAAVGEACDPIRAKIRELGLRHSELKALGSAVGGYVPDAFVFHTRTGLEAINREIVAEATDILYMTGSRSRDLDYLKSIETALVRRPKLIFYRVLHGAPHKGVFKEHLLRLLQLRDPNDRTLGYKSIHIGLFEDPIRQFEVSLLGNEQRAVMVLPSLHKLSGYDSGVLFTGRNEVEGLKSLVMQLYAASRPVESTSEVASLPVLMDAERKPK
jgi:hypothetical protein